MEDMKTKEIDPKKVEKTAIIIPARLQSSRLKNKLLLEAGGKPVIQWVYEAATKAKAAKQVIVACDSKEIYDCVKNFGGKVEMTSNEHKSGSDRLAEVVRRHDEIEYILNLQGDEPEMKSEVVDELIAALHNSTADISTLVREIKDEEQIKDPNCVKCVFNKKNYALYFSRHSIPYPRNKESAKYYAHIGMYAYKRESLLKMTSLEMAEIEKTESLEQLRALYNGMTIKVIQTALNPVGIDTIQDFEKFKQAVEG